MYLAGINCHSPVNARWYSPGFLHFIMLSQQLAAEGYNFFDLTPGYDLYKEELANGHDEVYEVVIGGKPAYRLKRRIRKWIHSRLVASGKRPMSTELALKRYAWLAKHRTPGSLINERFKFLRKKEKQQQFLLQTYTLPAATKVSLNKDSIIDLQAFTTGKRSTLTKWEFLGDAVYRLERGQHCYTWVENGVLSGCVWFFDKPDTDDTVEISGFYYHATAGEQVTGFINEVIDTAVNKERKNYIVTAERSIGHALQLAGAKIV